MASRRITTPPFRGSFVNLLEPQEKTRPDGSKYYVYSVTMLFDDEALQFQAWKEFEAIVDEAAKERWPNGIPKTGIRSPFRYGAWKSPTNPTGFDLDKYPENEGKMVVVASAYTTVISEINGVKQYDMSKAPGLCGPDPQAIFDPRKDPIYSGMYARACVSAYVPRNPQAVPGVSIGLHHVQKCYDGEPLGITQGRPENAFDEFIPPDAAGYHSDLLQDEPLGV